MPITLPKPDTVLDLTEASCPHLLIAIITTMRRLAAGQVVQVIATDLAAPSHITAWARQSGQNVLDLYQEDGNFIFWLQRTAVLEPAGGPIPGSRTAQSLREDL